MQSEQVNMSLTRKPGKAAASNEEQQVSRRSKLQHWRERRQQLLQEERIKTAEKPRWLSSCRGKKVQRAPAPTTPSPSSPAPPKAKASRPSGIPRPSASAYRKGKIPENVAGAGERPPSPRALIKAFIREDERPALAGARADVSRPINRTFPSLTCGSSGPRDVSRRERWEGSKEDAVNVPAGKGLLSENGIEPTLASATCSPATAPLHDGGNRSWGEVLSPVVDESDFELASLCAGALVKQLREEKLRSENVAGAGERPPSPRALLKPFIREGERPALAGARADVSRPRTFPSLTCGSSGPRDVSRRERGEGSKEDAVNAPAGKGLLSENGIEPTLASATCSPATAPLHDGGNRSWGEVLSPVVDESDFELASLCAGALVKQLREEKLRPENVAGAGERPPSPRALLKAFIREGERPALAGARADVSRPRTFPSLTCGSSGPRDVSRRERGEGSKEDAVNAPAGKGLLSENGIEPTLASATCSPATAPLHDGGNRSWGEVLSPVVDESDFELASLCAGALVKQLREEKLRPENVAGAGERPPSPRALLKAFIREGERPALAGARADVSRPRTFPSLTCGSSGPRDVSRRERGEGSKEDAVNAPAGKGLLSENGIEPTLASATCSPATAPLHDGGNRSWGEVLSPVVDESDFELASLCAGALVKQLREGKLRSENVAGAGERPPSPRALLKPFIREGERPALAGARADVSRPRTFPSLTCGSSGPRDVSRRERGEGSKEDAVNAPAGKGLLSENGIEPTLASATCSPATAPLHDGGNRSWGEVLSPVVDESDFELASLCAGALVKQLRKEKLRAGVPGEPAVLSGIDLDMELDAERAELEDGGAAKDKLEEFQKMFQEFGSPTIVKRRRERKRDFYAKEIEAGRERVREARAQLELERLARAERKLLREARAERELEREARAERKRVRKARAEYEDAVRGIHECVLQLGDMGNAWLQII